MSCNNHFDIEVPLSNCDKCPLLSMRKDVWEMGPKFWSEGVEDLKYPMSKAFIKYGDDIIPHVDYIFVKDKGTDYDLLMGYTSEDGKLFHPLLDKVGIKSYAILPAILCRTIDGHGAKIKEIECCRVNFEALIYTIINGNKEMDYPPPKIILIGGNNPMRTLFFDDKEIVKGKITSMIGRNFHSSRYEGIDIRFISQVYTVINDPLGVQIWEDQLNEIIHTTPATLEELAVYDSNYSIVDNIEQLDLVAEVLHESPSFAYDIETGGLRYRTMKVYDRKKRKRGGVEYIEEINTWDHDMIIGISFSNERYTGCYIPLWVKGKSIPAEHFNKYIKQPYHPEHIYFWFGEENEDYVLDKLKEILEDPIPEKSAHNGKFDNQFLYEQLDIVVKNFKIDTMIASYLLNENTPNSLEYQSDTRYPDLRGYKQKVYGLLTLDQQTAETYADIPLSILALYGGKDTDATFRLSQDIPLEMAKEQADSLIKRKDSKLNSMWLLENLYMPLQDVYARSELLGVKFDIPYVDKLSKELEAECADIEEGFQKAFGNMNLNSPAQLKKWLYTPTEEGGMGYIPPVVTAASSMAPRDYLHKLRNGLSDDELDDARDNGSTSKDAIKQILEMLFLRGKKDEASFLEALLKYKNNKKLVGTYLKGKKLLNRMDKESRIHYSFKLIGTVSGRLSSTPNIQNIPKDKRVRGIFIPEKGYKFASVDLSQAELRLMADYANDLVMLNYIDNDVDIHWLACLDLFYHSQKLTYDPNNPEMKRYRKLTKLCNFGKLYGSTAQKVWTSVNEKLESHEEKLSIAIAEAHGEWFFSTFFRIKQYLKENEDFMLRYGYIDSIFGRRRRLPDALITGDDPKSREKRAAAVREGNNAQIQGTASDIAQWGFIRLDKFFRGEYKFEGIQKEWKSRVLFTVHDEVDMELWEPEVEELTPLLPRIFTQKDYPIDRVKVKLDSELSIYKERWGS